MRVDNDTGRDPERISKNDIRSLSRDSRERKYLRHGPRNLATELFENSLRCCADALRFVSKETGRVDIPLQFFLRSGGEIARASVLSKQVRSNDIYTFIGTLRREDGRDEKLECARVV
jgi:hypothetical protein